MNLRPGPPLDDSRASHDARVRWLLAAFPGAVVLSGPPAPLPRPVLSRRARAARDAADYRARPYPAATAADRARPSRTGRGPR